MFSTKTLIAAASLAVAAAAGIGPAAAQPWYHHDWRERGWERHDRFEDRVFVGRVRVAEELRWHRYRMIGNPYFFEGRYVVRSYDPFGRPVLVQIDPYTGAFLGEVIL